MKTLNSPQPTRCVAPEPPPRATTISNPDVAESLATTTTVQSPSLGISNAMVALYKEAFGRGPTKTRAQFAGPDALLVILESGLTAAERNLVAMGEHQRIREARLFLTDALEAQFRAIVEQALGRKTLAYVSGLDTVRDVTINLFTLEPVGDGADPDALAAQESMPP